MLEVEPTGQRGGTTTGSGPNFVASPLDGCAVDMPPSYFHR